MSGSDVTREGLRGTRPDREAMTGVNVHRRGRGRHRAEQPMVPPAKFSSYYGKPILNQPVWESPDIPGYLFLGGLAGGSSLLAAGADLTGRPALGKVTKTGAAAAGLLSLAALIHDLGRPARFLHMLRVFKVTSPMSVGTWLLSAYVPAAGVASVTALTGRLRWAGYLATAGAALLAPAVASYTAALISDTAVPSWHDGYPEMPFVFTGSGAMAAGGLGLLARPARGDSAGPQPGAARRRHGDGRAGADGAAHRPDGGTVLGRPRRQVRQGREDPRRGRRGRRAGRHGRAAAPPGRPGRRGAVGRRADHGVRGHPVGHLPRRARLRRGPQIHGGAAAPAARPAGSRQAARLTATGRT